jgi:6-phosphogluconolactonase
MSDVRIYPTPNLLARAVAEQIVDLAASAIATHNRFTLVLSGGSTPKLLYEALASDEYVNRIEWEYVHVFWGDERCVPPEHTESNYHMARLAMLDYVPIPVGNIHRLRGEHEPEQAAKDYEWTLYNYFAKSSGEGLRGRFDLVLLGMGDDGHTASLFPHTAAIHETEKWVMAQHIDKLNATRLTLTPMALNTAAYVFMLVTGQSKANTLLQVFQSSPREAMNDLPIHAIQPSNGKMIWYVDEAAAARIKPSPILDVPQE